jgi:hypothetical protein
MASLDVFGFLISPHIGWQLVSSLLSLVLVEVAWGLQLCLILAASFKNFDKELFLTRFKVEQILEGVLVLLSSWWFGQLISKETKPSNAVLLISAGDLVR